ncbi:probable NADH kinase [Zingiber officinale]|uniref:probable NADH kinase n=1 Tax=Zingiber officinale TaxID=94328 RepID=UPI001C4D617E|nr:probable NADH kinase [Zingiber officinale]XP_042468628.1 probable NADH kinase [Zingiber officinale]
MSVRRRVLLLLKPLDVYPTRPTAVPKSPSSSPLAPKILSYLDDRVRVHKETINFCKDVLQRKSINWEPLLRNNLSQPVRHVDLVITVGGDGTLLQASHFLDDSVPVLGVNSDPTQADEVNAFSNEFDATRSTGYLCAATAGNFEQVLDEILEGHKLPSQLSRISVSLNGHCLPTYALNDILAAHPCPASVSRFSFRIKRDAETSSRLVNCRSSGLRVSTAAGSTAAMLSAGGFRMPSSSNVLQYMVREPILLSPVESPWLHGSIEPDQSMQIAWYNQEGVIYFDGSHVQYSIQHGDSIELSALAPILKVYLSQRESTNDIF